jgi:hypothetical protein
MFTTPFRDRVRHFVLELARTDARVTGGAITGSASLDASDRWSDVDVAFGIAEGHSLGTVLDDWTRALDREFGVIHHFDLRVGRSRVFLLPDGLEVDVAVAPAGGFGAWSPEFRAVFGTAQQLETMPQPEAAYLTGMGWLSVFHARACIERIQPWKAEFWISGVRDQVIGLACLRLNEDAIYGRSVDRLPTSVTGPLADALVRSLDAQELRRALAAATACLIGELEQGERRRNVRLFALLREFGGQAE